MRRPATPLTSPLSAVRTAIANPPERPTQVSGWSALRTSRVSRVSSWREAEFLILVHGRVGPALACASCPHCGQTFQLPRSQ